MTFAEGVAHLGDDCAQATVRVLAVEQTDRIEYPAEHARQAQQTHAAAGQVDAGTAQGLVDPGAQAARRGCMVAVVQAQQIEAIVGEQAVPCVQLWQGVDVHQEVEQPVDEAIQRRHLAPVHDLAAVQNRRLVGAGVRRRIHNTAQSGRQAGSSP